MKKFMALFMVVLVSFLLSACDVLGPGEGALRGDSTPSAAPSASATPVALSSPSARSKAAVSTPVKATPTATVVVSVTAEPTLPAPTAQPVTPTPPALASPSAGSQPIPGQVCILAKELAVQKGWIVRDLPKSVTDFGGAVVTLPPGAVLPLGWEWIPPGKNPNEGGVFSIYPPQGQCRDQLGVSR